MAQVGRISGPLLTANLERNGIDLAFRDTLDTTQLLYFNVVDGKLAINSDTATRELTVVGTSNIPTIFATTSASLANLNFENNSINTNVGDVFLNAQSAIQLSNLETDNIRITDNNVSTYRSNANIDIIPNGSGTVEIPTNLNVYQGNLYTTQNITLDGNIEFGDNLTQDTVVFNADVNSDIIPTVDQTYNLGSASNQWGEIQAYLLNGEEISTSSIAVGNSDLGLRQGNIFYVAENGNDSNVGDHPQGPFKTIRRALQAADASIQGPVVIHVFAGGYEEETPLVVPNNVTIIGSDMRNTIIRPESAYQSEDIFHLNGESTVQNLTIKDFYYDNINDTGYAFRFAPNTVVTTRSPYVQNITVITQGTTTSASDPRGFASGDAGKGALVDGASVNSASQEASMLFHSVTFITPGVDGLTMTNGVRVEWLNSFTYFANRGLYAVDGLTGHLSTDGSTVKYGAELRSIGSANVYGNYGAVADGTDTLMYLIQHNFAYIGAGKFTDNDPSRVIQSQEVTELNSGKIYYQSIDHLGNFRVGDSFFINQEDGTTSFDVESVTGSVVSDITISDGINSTLINGERILTGNIRISDNLIQTVIGDFNIDPTTVINLNSNVNISQNLDITGNLTFDGTINVFGNELTDTVNLNVDIDQTLIPSTTNNHSLGSLNKRWTNIWVSEADSGDIKIKNNYITTNISNADLELRANGTGEILVNTNNVQVTQNLTVNGLTSLQGTTSTGTLTQIGNRTQTGNFSTTNLVLSEKLITPQEVQFEKININNNIVSTIESNSDLELRANGTGEILVPISNVQINNNLSASIINTTNVNVATEVTLNEIQITDSLIELDDNFISTTISNADLELKAEGNGIIDFDTNDVRLNAGLNVQGTTTFNNNITLSGLITHSGDLSISSNLITTDLTLTEILDVTLQAQFEEILVDGNVIATTTSNADLELRANGSGNISIPNSSVQINNNLNAGTVSSSNININNSVALEEFEASTDIQIFDNVITTTNSNSNLELRANGTGDKFLQNIKINNNTIRTDSSTIMFNIGGKLDIAATSAVILPKGTTAQRSNTQGDLRFNTTDNVFEGYSSATITFNGVYDADRNTSLLAHPTNNTLQFILNNISAGYIDSTSIFVNGLQVDDVFINDRSITTNVSNSNLELRTNGTGELILDSITLVNNRIKNNHSGGLIVSNTGFGYNKLSGVVGAVVPLSGIDLVDNVNEIDEGTDITDSVVFSTDNAVRVQQGSVSATGNGIQTTSSNQVIGSVISGSQNFFLDFGLSGIDDVIDIEITQVRFRGDFQDANEYVDLILPNDNGSGTYTTRIGELEDNGDTDQWTISGVFNLVAEDIRTYDNTGAEASGFATVVVESGGSYGINITVDVPATMTDIASGMTNLWELEISYTIRTNITQFDEYDSSTNNHYYLFDEDSISLSDNDRYIVTPVLDITDTTQGIIKGKLIVGSGSNGGQLYAGDSIWLQYSDDGSDDTGMNDLALIMNSTNAASFYNWTDFSVTFEIPEAADLSNIKFRIQQENGGNKGQNSYAITHLQIYVDQSNSSSPQEGAFRYNVIEGEAQVYSGSAWEPAVGPAGDVITEADMDLLINEWSLILG